MCSIKCGRKPSFSTLKYFPASSWRHRAKSHNIVNKKGQSPFRDLKPNMRQKCYHSSAVVGPNNFAQLRCYYYYYIFLKLTIKLHILHMTYELCHHVRLSEIITNNVRLFILLGDLKGNIFKHIVQI